MIRENETDDTNNSTKRENKLPWNATTMLYQKIKNRIPIPFIDMRRKNW